MKEQFKEAVKYEIRMWWEWSKRTCGVVAIFAVATLIHVKFLGGEVVADDTHAHVTSSHADVDFDSGISNKSRIQKSSKQ